MSSNAASRLIAANDATLPRFRIVGDVTLDLFHRDGRVDDKWLGFHPREFELLWRLSETPGERVTKKQLLVDVWRINFEPETNSVAVHVARVRSKLEPHGLVGLLATHAEGGYYIDTPDQHGEPNVSA
ncbi:MAG: winged helix-turn-helix domain-containing protein [Pseudomonadota bacterium]